MLAHRNIQLGGAERYWLLFIAFGAFSVFVGIIFLITGIQYIWPLAVVGGIFMGVGVVLCRLGMLLNKRTKYRIQAPVVNPQRIIPTVVGNNPANYGIATAPQGYYPPQGQPSFPQGQTGPICHDPPDEGNVGPIEPSAPPSYGEATGTK